MHGENGCEGPGFVREPKFRGNETKDWVWEENGMGKGACYGIDGEKKPYRFVLGGFGL